MVELTILGVTDCYLVVYQDIATLEYDYYLKIGDISVSKMFDDEIYTDLTGVIKQGIDFAHSIGVDPILRVEDSVPAGSSRDVDIEKDGDKNKMAKQNVERIARSWLSVNGYDGLCDTESRCGCDFKESPNRCRYTMQCQLAYKHECEHCIDKCVNEHLGRGCFKVSKPEVK